MQDNYLSQSLPFLSAIEEERRKEFENYFGGAPSWLIELLQMEDMEEGTVFIHSGTPVDTIYFLASGMIKATEYCFYGITYDFMRFDKVHAIGAMEILMDLDCYQTTLCAVTKCKVLKLPKDKFEQWLYSDSQALKNEAKLMGECLLEEGKRSRSYLFLQGSNRLAMLLANRYEEYAQGDVLYMNGDRQDLSDATGLCTKTINRSVKKFTEEGVIGREKRGITINFQQYQKLKAMIDEVFESDIGKEKR